MNGYKEIPAERMDGNIIDMLNRQWMLVTAAHNGKCNTMTASWGAVGVIWGKPAATIYIRPQRYTKELIDASERLSLSFMGDRHRDALVYCGSHSGRMEDKIAKAGLSVGQTPAGTPYIEDAQVILECRKMYRDKFGPAEFIDRDVMEKVYPEKDFHYFYICEIEKVYIKE